MNAKYTGDFELTFQDPCNGFKIHAIREGNMIEFWQGTALVHRMETESPDISKRALIYEIKKIRNRT